MAEAGKASVPEVKDYFGDVTAKDLIALKRAKGITHATAYDELAYGIGSGTFTY